jgi:hypothetical protein
MCITGQKIGTIIIIIINQTPITNHQFTVNYKKCVGFALARRDSVLDQKREQGEKES